MMARAWAAVDRLLASAIAAIMAVMVVNVVWQVFTRFVLATPSSYTEELARYLLIWLTLLGSAYASGQRLHLAVDVVSARLPAAARRRVDHTVHATMIVFALIVMVGGGAHLTYLGFTLAQVSAALQVSLGFVYLAVPVSGLAIAFYSLAAWHETSAAPRAADPAPPPASEP